jgi:beta-lactamase regulating signal transducer with metallopeptidase domain
MTLLSHTFDIVSYRAAEMAVASLWQGVLITGALALLLRFVPRISAAYRFSIWAAAFIAMVALSLSSLTPEFFAGATHAASVIATKPLLVFDTRWSLAIAGLWLAASLARAADLAVHSLRLRKLWKDAKPVQIDARIQALLAGAAARPGRRPVEVCVTTTLQRPSVIGFFRPRILVPDWLFARLTQSELEQIALHEAEHLRRRDDWTNLVQKLCLVLFPLNPALMWIERRMCREREMACDEGVVRVTRAPRAYAACLASLAERGLERRAEALSLGAWERRPELVHRVQSILRSKGMLNPAAARLLLGSLGCGLLAGSVALGRSPQLVGFAAKPEQPVAIASAEHSKAGSRFAYAASRTSNGSELPVAMDVTLRQPSTAGAIALKASAPRQTSDGAIIQAKSKRHDAKNFQGEQLLVLTEWEQVETPSDNNGLISDYDTRTMTAKNDGATTSRDQQPGRKITFTQLIFKVSPSSASSISASKPGAKPSTVQPGVALFHDGWLVIRL